MKRRGPLFVAILAAWVAGFVPLLWLLVPFGRSSDLGFYLGGAIALAYFFAPPVVISVLER